MKNLLVIVSFILISVGGISAQSADAVYEQVMQRAVTKLDSSHTVPLLKQQKNQFARISSKYTEEWLPLYYWAYCNIQSVYLNQKEQTNAQLLDEAEEKLSLLQTLRNANRSEVNTLWGYYYTALIALDPQNNGAKYFGQVMSYYKQAIEQDSSNPRPVYLLALFETNLPAFMQQGKDFCGQLAKAAELYKVQEPKSINPHWGREFLNMLQTKCN